MVQPSTHSKSWGYSTEGKCSQALKKKQINIAHQLLSFLYPAANTLLFLRAQIQRHPCLKLFYYLYLYFIPFAMDRMLNQNYLLVYVTCYLGQSTMLLASIGTVRNWNRV